jgi:hypothetical protein
VVAVVGRSTLSAEQARAAGLHEVRALADSGADTATLMAQAGPLVQEAAEALGRRWLRRE